ncbi:thioredoxin family protein [Stieleria varia]|uniref:Thioredoxin n=1 Tax=Stieleria varia TaxID=2528005 RepID=A0A5C6AFH9_9BACT|nr:thioredoxin family protein [Stieleria varia]TWT98369.1 Thioredoxin [Stieleria varia]
MSNQSGFMTAFAVLVIAAAGIAIWNRSHTPSLPASAESLVEYSADADAPTQPNLRLIKFGATWCPPCRALDSELEQLNLTHSDMVSVIKVDVDEHPELAEEYNVNGIPRLLLVQGNQIIGDQIGYYTHDELTRWIRETAAANPVKSE